jgi:succinyl-diaminopimelate desuccinylase
MKDSIINLTKDLVRIPSRAGIDPMENIQDFLKGWLLEKGIPAHPLFDPEGNQIGLYLHVTSKNPGPAICLNACLDTAPFGDEEQWKYPPTSARIEDGFLYGRGAADSKVAVSIFSHLALKFQMEGTLPAGNLYIVFDADEHTGNFHGILSFLEVCKLKPDAVLIGYPGNENLIVGSRGFLRAELSVFGKAAHSGSSSDLGNNAIYKMAKLMQDIQEKKLPRETDPIFGIGPKVTVTEILGGQGYNLVPDRCTCKLDIRLTPNVDKNAMVHWMENLIKDFDGKYVGQKSTTMRWKESWPAFYTPVNSPLVESFLEAVTQIFKKEIKPTISGPSNIGNLLASKGIAALSGFGVSYAKIHAADEKIELESIAPVYEVYREVINRIMTVKKPQVV